MRLECPFYGDPEPVVSWSVDGKKIENDWNSQKMKIYNGGKILEIASIEGSDSGKYVCTGNNEVGLKQVEHNVKVIGKINTKSIFCFNFSFFSSSSDHRRLFKFVHRSGRASESQFQMPSFRRR